MLKLKIEGGRREQEQEGDRYKRTKAFQRKSKLCLSLSVSSSPPLSAEIKVNEPIAHEGGSGWHQFAFESFSATL